VIILSVLTLSVRQQKAASSRVKIPAPFIPTNGDHLRDADHSGATPNKIQVTEY